MYSLLFVHSPFVTICLRSNPQHSFSFHLCLKRLDCIIHYENRPHYIHASNLQSFKIKNTFMTFKIPSKWVSTIYKCSCLILQWNTKCIDALHFDSNKSKKNKLFIFGGGFLLHWRLKKQHLQTVELPIYRSRMYKGTIQLFWNEF